MRTLCFKLNFNNPEDQLQLKEIQNLYSRDFRRVYNNLELTQDKTFLKSLRTKSSKLKDYLIKEVISFKEKYDINKSKILDKITELEKLNNLSNKQFKNLVNLKKSFKSNICFGGRLNLKRRTKNLISNEEWKEQRLYTISIQGETSRKGSRFFDFKNISNGELLFKLESTDIKIPLRITTLKFKQELSLLQNLSNQKKISISVRLTYNKIFITYDESLMYDNKFDYKLFNTNKPSNMTKEESKLYWRSKYQEHENKLKNNKLERYLSIDINPNEIGYNLVDKNMNILDKGCYQITGKVSENKRKFEYSQIIKDLFKKVRHFKVSYFIIEDLKNLNKDNFGNQNSNRKNKLEFKKNFIFSLIKRRCNETGTILRKINPVYSSFIGNLTYQEYDPIASSLEISRRGIDQYNQGFKLIPDLHSTKIFTDKIDKYCKLNEYKGFIDLFKSIRDKSYRRKDKIFLSQKFSRGGESHVYLYI